MTSLSADTGTIVLVRRRGAPAVATVVGYVAPRGKGADLQLVGLDEPSYRGPDPLIVRRLAAAALRSVLPSHQVHGEVVWSGTGGSAGAAAWVNVRLDVASGLNLLVEEAGAAASTAAKPCLAPPVAGRLVEIGP